MTRWLTIATLFLVQGETWGRDWPMVGDAPIQPVRVNVTRLHEALRYIGQADPDSRAPDNTADLAAIQARYDPLCFAAVTINPESRVSVEPGPAPLRLVEGVWTSFLVKVVNQAGVTAPLRVLPSEHVLEVSVYEDRPLNPRLSAAGLEYRIISLRTKADEQISEVLTFDVGQGTQDVGFRSDLTVTFAVEPVVDVILRPMDEDGKPTTAAFEIRDEKGRSWPPQVGRIEPDFRFHPQVYRVFGEKVALPAGDYTVTVTRGPEYYHAKQDVTITEESRLIDVRLERWIDPSDFGWWSGDHHIHAAGCKHYESPSEGVHAAAMMRHCRGEDLKVGANLTWGPCFDYQKQFFTGRMDRVSEYPYILRYDVEVSGFGSHRSGHLCLLRLREQIYPGGDSKDHWPTLCLNTLRWAQKQGAVCGPAHSGWGLGVESDELPNYEIPPYDGIGANEYIVDVTHTVEGPEGTQVPAVDFLSMVDTPPVWELNIWYHTLNCGYRTRISGETDFPCIYGERVGLGRSYIKIDGKLDYDSWCEGISLGRGYVCDGRSHLIDMTVNDVEIGTQGSEVRIGKGETVTVSAQVAALLGDNRELRDLPQSSKPFWHIERARVGEGNTVAVELVANGQPIARQEIEADGSLDTIAFEDVALSHSSWLALRIYPSSHTNPVFVLVDGKPIRASRRSARWCLDGVDQCWSQKENLIAPQEREEALAVYEHARQAYAAILAESVAD